MQKRSLGLIETLGYVPAIEAADAASKAANVRLLGYEEVRAGLVTVKLVGDVAAVKAAVSAASVAAAAVGTVISQHVIARPDRQLSILDRPPPPESPPEPQSEPEADVEPTATERAEKEQPPAGEDPSRTDGSSSPAKAKKPKASAGKPAAKGKKKKS